MVLNLSEKEVRPRHCIRRRLVLCCDV
ncbi:unnamed protein product, partial [Rotaria sp. Silwood1]